MKLYKNLAKAFFKPFKKLLLKFSDNAKLLRKWNRLKPMSSLKKSEIDELLKLRKLNKRGYNKNAAIMKAELEINGEIIELEYKALAGKQISSGEELVKSANIDDIARELKMSKEEVLKLFKSEDPISKQTIGRFFDSEYKIFNKFDDELFQYQAAYGIKNVKVKSVKFKTLYEPCLSCKRQMIIRKEMYKFELKVSATALKKGVYAKGNRHLEGLGLLKK